MGIRLENVCFSYKVITILKEVNLTIKTGEHIGIVGTSGGGKSTLLKLLAGLYEIQSGVIEVEGKINPTEIRNSVAMVMQNAMLLPTSIRENITCGHPMSDEVIKRACEAAELSEWIGDLPEGLLTFVGERGSKVSGGQAQRIAIARAIAKDAPVILLDEATSALDGDTSNAVLLAIKNLTEGKTVVSVSHRPEALINCNRIYRLEGGSLRVT